MARQTPQVSLQAAREYAYRAAIVGSDAAPLHGDCEAPKHVEMRGVQTLLPKQLRSAQTVDQYWDRGQWTEIPGTREAAAPPNVTTVVIRVRCRKCRKCLSQKRRQWTAKAIAEVRNSVRTWFVTLTIGPDRRLWARASAERWAHTARAEAFSMMTPLERTRAIAQFLSPEVTRWLKRVRKESGAELRYLLVVEAHEDGFPHFHLLVHERGQPVGERVFRKQWKWGFAHAKLLSEPSKAGYACKYINKSVQTRVRASRRYGDASSESITHLIRNVRDATKEENNTPLKPEKEGTPVKF